MIRVLEFADVINKSDFIDTIVQNADREHFEMSVVVRTEKHNIARPEFARDVKYKLLPGNSRTDALGTAYKLSRLLNEWDIDILHAHHFEQAIVGWMATGLHRKTKLVIGRHYSDSLYRLNNKFKHKALLRLEQTINRAAARIIVPSAMISEILTERQNVDPEKVDVILYGFDPAKYASIRSEDVSRVRVDLGFEGRFVVGNFSRLHEEKGQRYLIEAAAEIRKTIPELLVVVVGEGPERVRLEQQIEELGLQETVKLLGWRTDAMALMAAVDVIAQSTLQEAFSQVMCEALWLGKPLVMSEVSGVRDIIQNGENGMVVPAANSTALTKAIVELAANNDLCRKLGLNGRQFVGENLTIGKMIRFYEDSFRRAFGTVN